MKNWIKKVYFLWKHGSIEQKWNMKIQNQALYILYFAFSYWTARGGGVGGTSPLVQA